MLVNNCKRVSDLKAPIVTAKFPVRIEIPPLQSWPKIQFWVTLSPQDFDFVFPKRHSTSIYVYSNIRYRLFFSVLNYSCSAIFFSGNLEEGQDIWKWILTIWTGRKRRPSGPEEHEEGVQVQSFLFGLQSLEITAATAAGMCRPQRHFQLDKHLSKQLSSNVNFEKYAILHWNYTKWLVIVIVKEQDSLRHATQENSTAVTVFRLK